MSIEVSTIHSDNTRTIKVNNVMRGDLIINGNGEALIRTNRMSFSSKSLREIANLLDSITNA